MFCVEAILPRRAHVSNQTMPPFDVATGCDVNREVRTDVSKPATVNVSFSESQPQSFSKGQAFLIISDVLLRQRFWQKPHESAPTRVNILFRACVANTASWWSEFLNIPDCIASQAFLSGVCFTACSYVLQRALLDAIVLPSIRFLRSNLANNWARVLLEITEH